MSKWFHWLLFGFFPIDMSDRPELPEVSRSLMFEKRFGFSHRDLFLEKRRTK